MSAPLTVAEVLNRAADLIEPEGAWVTGVGARDANGSSVAPYSPRATCWCMEGAIGAVTRHQWGTLALDREPACKVLRKHLGKSAWSWNDSQWRTQAEVVAKLREAAALSLANPSNDEVLG